MSARSERALDILSKVAVAEISEQSLLRRAGDELKWLIGEKLFLG